MHSLGNCNVCLCGVFNFVRSSEERPFVRGSQTVNDFASFNEFIDDCVVIDLPLNVESLHGSREMSV